MDQVDRIIDKWRAARPDLAEDLGPMALIGRMKRLSQHLGHGLETVFQSYALNAASFDVLATLRRSGPPYALSPSELMAWTMVTSGTMTNRIDRLEKAGHVVRRTSPDDARSTLVQLSDAGFALIDAVVSAHVANQARLCAALSAADRADLDRVLAKWLAAFEGEDGAPKG